MGRDDELPAAVGRVDDARHEVRERLADPRSRLDEQRLVVAEGGRDRVRHQLLAGPVLEVQIRLKPTAFSEGPPGELRRPAGGRRWRG